MIFSTNNSTLEGSTISFRCTNELMGTDVFMSKCFRNASWVPDPIRQCAVDGERGISRKSQTVAITGSLFGVLAVIIIIIATLSYSWDCYFCQKRCSKLHRIIFYIQLIRKFKRLCMQAHFGDRTEGTWRKQISYYYYHQSDQYLIA